MLYFIFILILLCNTSFFYFESLMRIYVEIVWMNLKNANNKSRHSYKNERKCEILDFMEKGKKMSLYIKRHFLIIYSFFMRMYMNVMFFIWPICAKGTTIISIKWIDDELLSYIPNTKASYLCVNI